MKLSCHWLKDLLPSLSATPDEIAQALTMHAFETEVASQIKIDPLIKVVKIIKIEPHPNADRLKVCKVETGAGVVDVLYSSDPDCDWDNYSPCDDGGFLAWSDIPNDRMLRWDETTGACGVSSAGSPCRASPSSPPSCSTTAR
jgi:hypothetical protein